MTSTPTTGGRSPRHPDDPSPPPRCAPPLNPTGMSNTPHVPRPDGATHAAATDGTVTEFPFATTEATDLTGSVAMSWAHAATHQAVLRYGILIAGVPMVFESTDTTLVTRLSRALGHHPQFDPDGDTTPAAVIHLWSLDDPQSRRPTVPQAVVQRAATHHTHRDGTQVRARFDPENRALMVWASTPGSECGEAWWCLESVARLQWWEEAAPLRPLLSWILPHHNRHFAHGAAVGDTDGAIMLVGPGGSGKSTTALACQTAGMGYLGDDYCLVSTHTSGPPQVHSLYGTAKLRIDDDLTLGPLQPWLLRATPPEGGKAVAVLTEHPDTVVTHSAPVVMVAAVSVGNHRHTVVEPASPADVLAALAPSSLHQLPGATAATFGALTDLVRTVPVCRIELGTARTDITATIADLLTDPHQLQP